MMKLPRRKLTIRAAHLPSPLKLNWVIFQIVQFHLHWAFHVIAKLSTLVLNKTFERHSMSPTTDLIEG